MRQPTIGFAVIGKNDLNTRPQIFRVETALVKLHPLQFELVDFHIKKRFCTGPEFNVKFNPDIETKAEFVAGYLNRLNKHIESTTIYNLDIQIEWLLKTLP